MKLKRQPVQYEGCTPKAIASGSEAQMMYFVEDAKADIATLLGALGDVIRICEAVRYSGGLGPGQIKRIDAAKSLLK